MKPTFRETGDIVLVDRRVQPREVVRGDVVNSATFRKNFHVCKRVLGLEGDELMRPEWEAPITVPPGHVWLEGDNPDNSTDSRHYGPLPVDLIRGKVVARVWPPWLFGTVPTSRPTPTSTRILGPGEAEEVRRLNEDQVFSMLRGARGFHKEAVEEVLAERAALHLLGKHQTKEDSRSRLTELYQNALENEVTGRNRF